MLAGLTGTAWLYLGIVAVLLLPDRTASWSTLGGLGGIVVGLVFVTAAALGDTRSRMLGKVGQPTPG